MNHRKNLLTAINELVRDYAEREPDLWSLRVSDLDSDDLDRITFLIWESENRPSDPFLEGYDNEIIDYVISKSLNFYANKENAADVVGKIAIQVYGYYANTLQTLIDDACLMEFVNARDYPND